MQNITFAGVGTRLVAQIIDGLILSFVLSLLIIPIIGVSFFSESIQNYGNDSAAVAMLGLTIVPIIVLIFAIPTIYETAMICSAKQATLGKIIMKIKVADEQGQRLTFGASLGRSLIKSATSSLCILLWLWPLFNDKQQALHDLVAKDYVVRD
jgi:uncharacterized RDD family membrane protein YckC